MGGGWGVPDKVWVFLLQTGRLGKAVWEVTFEQRAEGRDRESHVDV